MSIIMAADCRIDKRRCSMMTEKTAAVSSLNWFRTYVGQRGTKNEASQEAPTNGQRKKTPATLDKFRR
jgi:hypothetical protein